jgi:hypothetical protein
MGTPSLGLAIRKPIERGGCHVETLERLTQGKGFLVSNRYEVGMAFIGVTRLRVRSVRSLPAFRCISSAHAGKSGERPDFEEGRFCPIDTGPFGP